MPTAVIWGCLRAAVDCSKRYLKLYENIGDQLKRLNAHIKLLTECEKLFADSLPMQELLQASYINILRFWRRVEKECNYRVTRRFVNSLAPFNTSKLDEIIQSIGHDAEQMRLQIPVSQEWSRQEDRRLAGLVRQEQAALVESHDRESRRKEEERKTQRLRDVRNWLCGGNPSLFESNSRHHEQNTRTRTDGTCEWLRENDVVKAWLDRETPASRLWVKAAPGVGKSVLTAYAIEQAERLGQTAVIYQYYTFDDEFPAAQVFRCLADQLVCYLWRVLGDIPSEIHDYVLQSGTNPREQDIQKVINMSKERIPTTYVFLDGLDEECKERPRRGQLLQVLDYFNGLASQNPQALRLWCSSQPHTRLDSVLGRTPFIEVTKHHNRRDIEEYLNKQMPELDALEIDSGYKTLILQDIRERAEGCFLWASLMSFWLSDATSLQMVQDRISEGLPKDYERYYQKRIENTEESQKDLVVVLLSCMVYAKRPLRLDELRECTAIVKTPYGKNIDLSQKVFKEKILEHCQPLIRVQESHGPAGRVSICTLSHSSVRNFLLKNPDVLSTTSNSTFNITPAVIAKACLTYLMQPRYKGLLTKRDDTFVDVLGQDIMGHHLLSYAAKYWDKHLDDVRDSTAFIQTVIHFITSPQFYTLLQVQSLFVEGQFSFWVSRYRSWAGKQIRRVFPGWIIPNCSEPLMPNYQTFVGEWGAFLERNIYIGSSYEGEIDRCFFPALGPKNFLHKGPCRYESFSLSQPDYEEALESLQGYFDGIAESGDSACVVRQQKIDKSSPILEFLCEYWHLSASHERRLRSSQRLSIPRSAWRLYDSPLSRDIPGRPPAVSFTHDLQYLRIGSQVYCNHSHDGSYKPLSILNPADDYFEEFASGHQFVAVATRRAISLKDLADPEQTTTQGAIEHFPNFVHLLDELAAMIQEQGTASTTDISIRTRSVTDRSSTPSSNSSPPSPSVKEADDICPGSQIGYNPYEHPSDDPDLSFESGSESAGNSAYTSWSEGSTEQMSEGVEGDDEWNDFDDKESILQGLEEEASSLGSADVDENEGTEALLSEAEVKSQCSFTDGVTSDGLYDLDNTAVSENDSLGIESHYSPSNYSMSDSQGDSEADEDTAFLVEMLDHQPKRSKEGQRTTLRVYDSTKTVQDPVFHYTCFVKRTLFDSPPAFHPSKPLVVWPLGDGNILFGNTEANTYFTRELGRSHSGSCHVFIKTHFSLDGQYLHFAALEAQEKTETAATTTEPLLLSLQVSTHRLSQRKTTNSPPRLIFRTTVDIEGISRIPVSDLPYFVTWSPKELFFTRRSEKLEVMKVSLFPSSNTSTSSPCYPRETIFLPRTALSRSIRFFPAPDVPVPGKKRKRFATLILGSHSNKANQVELLSKHEILPPVGIYLREDTDLGGWACRDDGGSHAKQRVKPASGRLKGKFESFDRDEDCDIVPYLF